MSVSYGVPPAGGYQPPGRVNFGWIGESWQFVGAAAAVWVLSVLLYAIVSAVVQSLLRSAFHNPNYVPQGGPFGNPNYAPQFGPHSLLTPVGQVVVTLFNWVYAAFQAASLAHMAVKQVRGEQIQFGDAFSGGPYLVNFLILNLLVTLACFAGFLALILGLFVVGGFLWPVQALTADGRGAVEAFTLSVDGMKKDWLNATLLAFVFTLIIVVSVLPCGLGVLVTVPMLYVMGALAYRDMIGMPGLGGPTGLTNPYGGPGAGVAPPGVWPPPPTA